MKNQEKDLQAEAYNENFVPFVDEVEEFNEVMGKGYQNRSTPTINPKDAQFVIDFIQEELDELKEAVKNKDVVEIFDAILDITYVGLGNGALVFGLKDKLIKGYNEVQASICLKFVLLKKKLKKLLNYVLNNKVKPVIMKKLIRVLLCIEQEIIK
jgi:hypothetical protein